MSSSSFTALALRSMVSTLGSIGQGTATTTPNFTIITNVGPIAPATTITFTANPFTAKTTGQVLVAAFMNVATQAAADEVEFLLRKDAGSLIANTFLNSATGPGGFLCDATLFWVDTVTVGVAHTYGIEAVLVQPGGHTLQVAAAGNVTVLAYELP